MENLSNSNPLSYLVVLKNLALFDKRFSLHFNRYENKAVILGVPQSCQSCASSSSLKFALIWSCAALYILFLTQLPLYSDPALLRLFSLHVQKEHVFSESCILPFLYSTSCFRVSRHRDHLKIESDHSKIPLPLSFSLVSRTAMTLPSADAALIMKYLLPQI